jgi:uncharacterized lipoprotein
MKFINILLLGVLLLTGCQKFQQQQYIADQDKKYLQAKPAEPLQIPANLNSTELTKDQVQVPALPASNNKPETQTPDLLPPGSLAAQVKSGEVSPKVLKQKLPDPS